MKKRVLLLTVLSLLLSLCLTGCADESHHMAWVLAHSSSEDTVTQLYSEKFAEEVERLSGGEMKIQVYSNSALGGDTELLESCEVGDIPFVVQNTAPQVSYLPKLALFDLPCVYSDIKDVEAVFDNPEFESKINDIYLSGGFRLLGMADQNFRVMSSNVKVEKLSDFKGIKIRTMENANHIAFWKALGAAPTPMTFSEVYIGLSQGTIDAQENPYEVIVSSKLYEQQKYAIQTNHLPHLISLIVSEDFFQKLTPEQQAIVQEAADNAKAYAREQAEERAEDRIQIMEEHGCEIVPLSDELLEQMRESAAPVYESIRKSVNDDALYNAYVGEN
jgi:tripartite ATP-independent transporter DctP family solute receptor